MTAPGLPTAAEALLVAWRTTVSGGDPEGARLALDIARELREGTVTTDQPAAKAIEQAPAAYQPGETVVSEATSYGDQAAGQTTVFITPEQPAKSYDPARTEVIHVDQPMPVPNSRGSVQALVRQDLVQRERVGIQRYGTPLQAFNGRDALRDAYEEALDLTCYLRQALAERDGTP